MATLTAAMATNKETDPQKLTSVEESSVSNRRSSRASTDSNPSEAPRRASMMTRRRSSFRNLATSVNFMRRLSMGKALREKEEADKPKLKCENTYRTEPESDDKFKCKKVRETVERLLNTYLRDEKYEERRCRQLSTDITTVVKNSIKDLNFKRYKIICNLVLGEKRGQGIKAVGRCCWDPNTDNHVTVHFENESIFAVCTVHGVYFE